MNLRTRCVQAFDHRGSGQLLYFKERFLVPDHPGIEAMKAFSAKLRKLGIAEQMGFGPTQGELDALLARHESGRKTSQGQGTVLVGPTPVR